MRERGSCKPWEGCPVRVSSQTKVFAIRRAKAADLAAAGTVRILAEAGAVKKVALACHAPSSPACCDSASGQRPARTSSRHVDGCLDASKSATFDAGVQQRSAEQVTERVERRGLPGYSARQADPFDVADEDGGTSGVITVRSRRRMRDAPAHCVRGSARNGPILYKL